MFVKNIKINWEYVKKIKGLSQVSAVCLGVGTELMPTYAARYPQAIEKMVFMDFHWDRTVAEGSPSQLQEVRDLMDEMYREPTGYYQLEPRMNNLIAPMLSHVSPEIMSWLKSTFQVAPVGVFTEPVEAHMSREVLHATDDIGKEAEKIASSILIIRGDEKQVTSQEDSFEFLKLISGEIRAYNLIKGAGAVPSIEEYAHKIVFKNVLWFLKD